MYSWKALLSQFPTACPRPGPQAIRLPSIRQGDRRVPRLDFGQKSLGVSGAITAAYTVKREKIFRHRNYFIFKQLCNQKEVANFAKRDKV